MHPPPHSFQTDFCIHISPARYRSLHWGALMLSHGPAHHTRTTANHIADALPQLCHSPTTSDTTNHITWDKVDPCQDKLENQTKTVDKNSRQKQLVQLMNFLIAAYRETLTGGSGFFIQADHPVSHILDAPIQSFNIPTFNRNL